MPYRQPATLSVYMFIFMGAKCAHRALATSARLCRDLSDVLHFVAYLSACACARACVRVHACARACVCVCVCVCAWSNGLCAPARHDDLAIWPLSWRILGCVFGAAPLTFFAE